MSSENLLDDLDYEDDVESSDQEYYCSVCCDCFDEEKEFRDHLISPLHDTGNSQRQAILQDGDTYCSLCIYKLDSQFDEHCKTNEEHVQYFNSVKRCYPNMPDPITKIAVSSYQCKPLESSSLHVAKSKKTISKSSSLKYRLVVNKCIGLTHIKRQGTQWFCNICLEKFTNSIDVHCNRAVHAIQTIKQFDPETAYKIKISAPQNDLRKTVNSLISSKVEEIYEKEKETPEYIEFMLQLDHLEKIKTIKREPGKVISADATIELSKTDQSIETSPEIKNCMTNETKAKPITDQCDQSQIACTAVTSTESTNIAEMVCLFEEDDRSFIPTPVSDESEKSKNGIVKIAANDSTVLVGLKYLKLKGNEFCCSLCDVRCGAILSSCHKHMTSSLHRRKMVNVYSSHPVPDYLEKLRRDNANLYSQLIGIESKKIEIKERTAEQDKDKETRAGILDLKNINTLPEPLELTDADKDLNLIELAVEWNAKSSKSLHSSSLPDNITTGSNKSTIRPIQPQMENLLIGVDAIKHLSYTKFHCTICNIKFDVKPKSPGKHHVNGRLHKMKALVASHGKNVDDYLQYRLKKDGYSKVTGVINQACVPLEKIEIESESSETREIRALLLGVKVDQLPLPMITMTTEDPFDIKLAADTWLGGNKGSPKEKDVPTNSVKSIQRSAPSSNKEENTVAIKADPQSFKPLTESMGTVDENARNIFELCKPAPVVTPENVISKLPKSGPDIKNIDIEGLRRSLIDINELGATGKSQDNDKEKDEAPESSKCIEEPMKHLSTEVVGSKLKSKSTEVKNTDVIVQPPAKRKICSEPGPSNTKKLCPSQGKSKHAESQRKPEGAHPRGTYNNLKQIHKQTSGNPTHLTMDRRPERNPYHENKYSESPNKLHPVQSSHSQDKSRNDNRNGIAGRSSNYSIQYEKSTKLAGRSTCFPEQQHERAYNIGTSQSRNNKSHDMNSYQQPNSSRHNFTENYRQSNNSYHPNPRPASFQSNKGSDNVERNMEQRSNPPQPQNIQSPQKFSASFDIDMKSIKNTSLSNALAKVTNIAPLSQACNSQINRHVGNHQNVRNINNEWRNQPPSSHLAMNVNGNPDGGNRSANHSNRNNYSLDKPSFKDNGWSNHSNNTADNVGNNNSGVGNSRSNDYQQNNFNWSNSY